MTIKIDKKITGYEVVKEESKRADSNVVHMHEKLGAPGDPARLDLQD